MDQQDASRKSSSGDGTLSPNSDGSSHKMPIELHSLAPPGSRLSPAEGQGLSRDSASYGSTMSIGADTSTVNLLRIDLEKKISRHTGEERETWDNRAEFVLSLIGYAVGLGNVWRFPYLTQKNGGGAFVIPYAVMLAIEGIPLFFLELAVGQRLRKGSIGAWNQLAEEPVSNVLRLAPYLEAANFRHFWVALMGDPDLLIGTEGFENSILADLTLRMHSSPTPQALHAVCPVVRTFGRPLADKNQLTEFTSSLMCVCNMVTVLTCTVFDLLPSNRGAVWLLACLTLDRTVSPFLGGVGICSAIVSFYLSLYYNTIMSWCIVYLFQCFQSPLPWATCPHHFGDNESYVVIAECEKTSPPSYFWYRSTLNTARSVESSSEFNWKIAVGLVAAWFIVFLCILKGIKTTGKVVYVTATFPYLVIVIFFFRGITLEGFDRGLEHLFVPEWHRLWDPEVWLDAATQIFYSFGLAFGSLIALASYNPVRSDFLRDTLIVTICDFMTSIFTAIVVFSILGFRATMQYNTCLEKQGARNNSGVGMQHFNETCNFKRIIEESASGTGLAFITFTDAINQFPAAPLWAVLFFLMLLTLGLDSMFGTLEGAITSLNDLMFFPRIRKEFVCGAVCLGCLLLSMCFATSTGPYVFALFDSFCANIPLLIIGFMECVAISYIYGLQQISDDIELMLGRRPSWFWLICWRYVMPVAMGIIFLSSIIEIMTKGVVYEAWDPEKAVAVLLPWPWWCKLLAALMILSSVLWIPGIAIARYFGFSALEKEEPAFFPTEELREEYGITTHKISQFERIVLGFKE